MTITRRQFVSTSSLSLAAVGLTRVSLFGQTPATQTPAGQPPAAQTPPASKFEEVRRGVGIFTMTGGTIGYLLNNDGGIAVDSQYMQNAETCVAGLKQKAPKGLELLINTHHHADHTGGNPVFKPIVKKIVAHREHRAPSLRDSLPLLSPALDDVFQKMVAKRPENRFASCAEVILALETCRAQGLTGEGATLSGISGILAAAGSALSGAPSSPRSRASIASRDSVVSGAASESAPPVVSPGATGSWAAASAAARKENVMTTYIVNGRFIGSSKSEVVEGTRARWRPEIGFD